MKIQEWIQIIKYCTKRGESGFKGLLCQQKKNMDHDPIKNNLSKVDKICPNFFATPI